jgi:hypothetical protein
MLRHVCLTVMLPWYDPPTPATPTPHLPLHLPSQGFLPNTTLILPLGHATSDANHAHELPLYDASDTFDFMTLIPRTKLRRGSAFMAHIFKHRFKRISTAATEMNMMDPRSAG